VETIFLFLLNILILVFITVDGEDENRKDNVCCCESGLTACYIGGFIVFLQNKLMIEQRNKLRACLNFAR